MPPSLRICRKQLSLADRRPELEALRTWIEHHLAEPIGWQELMAQSGLDHQTINALFCRYCGSAPMAWIRKQRERQALDAQMPAALPPFEPAGPRSTAANDASRGGAHDGPLLQ